MYCLLDREGGRSMVGKRRPYLAYMLRRGLVEDDGAVGRASLEAPGRAERHGFPTVDELFAFLQAETDDLAAEEQWGTRAETERKAVRLANEPPRQAQSGDRRMDCNG